MRLHAGSATVDVFGIFDGHGGKQAATFASKHMAAALLEELQACLSKQQTAEKHGNGIAIPSKHSNGAHSEGAALAACAELPRGNCIAFGIALESSLLQGTVSETSC